MYGACVEGRDSFQSCFCCAAVAALSPLLSLTFQASKPLSCQVTLVCLSSHSRKTGITDKPFCQPYLQCLCACVHVCLYMWRSAISVLRHTSPVNWLWVFPCGVWALSTYGAGWPRKCGVSGVQLLWHSHQLKCWQSCYSLVVRVFDHKPSIFVIKIGFYVMIHLIWITMCVQKPTREQSLFGAAWPGPA